MGRECGIIFEIRGVNDDIIDLLHDYRIFDYNLEGLCSTEEEDRVEIELLYLRKCGGIANDLRELLYEYSYEKNDNEVFSINIDNIQSVINCLSRYEDRFYFDQWADSYLYSYPEYIDIAMRCKAALLKFQKFLQEAPIWFEYECYFYDDL